MKKILIVLVVFINIISILSKVPEIYSDYIIDIEKKVNKKAVIVLKEDTKLDSPDRISKKQALEDVEEFYYILNNAYSGLDFYIKKGIDFSDRYQDVISRIKSENSVNVSDLEQWLSFILDDINDKDVFIEGDEIHKFFKHDDLYYTELVIEKIGDTYIVANSALDEVRDGTIYKGSKKYLLKTLAPDEKEHFLVGMYSKERRSSMDLLFESDGSVFKTEVPVHIAWNGYDKYRKSSELNFDFRENVVLIKGISSSEDQLLNDQELINNVKATDNMIIDLSNETKIDIKKWNTFLKKINGSINIPGYFAQMSSPALGDNNSTRLFKLNFDVAGSIKEYEGNVYVVINRNTSEQAQRLALNIKNSFENVFLVGENTSGGLTFNNKNLFVLRNSKIKVSFPSDIYINRIDENKGITPDIYLDCSDISEELISYIQDPKSYMFNFSCKLPLDKKEKVLNYMQQLLSSLFFDKNTIPLKNRLLYKERMDFDSYIKQDIEHVFEFNVDKGKNIQSLKLDRFTVINGKSSLRLKNSYYTDVFNVIVKKIPQVYLKNNSLFLNYSVKGRRLVSANRPEYGAFVMIVYLDDEGNIKIDKKEYEHSFDWKKERIEIHNKNKKEIFFVIGNFIPGALWLDGIFIDGK